MITLTREEAQQVLKVLEYPGPSWPESRTELAVALRYKLSAPEPEPVAKLFGTLPVYETKQDGILTVNAPPQRDEASAKAAEWQGLTDEEIRNEAKNHVFDESFFSGAIWARGQIMGKNNE